MPASAGTITNSWVLALCRLMAVIGTVERPSRWTRAEGSGTAGHTVAAATRGQVPLLEALKVWRLRLVAFARPFASMGSA